MSGARYRLGVDVGGTHTDLVVLDKTSGELLVEKVSSTPKNPALGVLNGLSRFVARGVAPGEIEFFAHGTTITTNALLEMRGAKVGLLITRGYRAVQEVQNQARDGNLFDYFYAKPQPIAPQSLTREIPERSDYAGTVLTPLDRDAVRRAARELKDAKVNSIAVCYLFAFMNPAHEETTRDDHPRGIPRRLGVAVERGAAAHPRMGADVDDAAQRLSRAGAGALHRPSQPRARRRQGRNPAALPDAVERRRDAVHRGDRRRPHRAHAVLRPGRRRAGQRLSGARRGAERAGHARHGRHLGGHRVHRGRRAARIHREHDRAPADRRTGARHELDLGRRRLDRLDRRRRLPQCRAAKRRRRSRPACYGRGGTRPTVTDADVVCGYLNPGYFLGGSQTLDVAASRKALQEHVAGPLKMDVLEAAVGIQRIVDMRMADEVRVFAAKRGVDLSAFTLLPFGGAGAVHAAAVAEELGMRRILVPPRPGAFSALGLLCTDVVHDYIRSELKPLADVTPEHAEDIFGLLEAKARDELRAEGMDPASAAFLRELDLRYTGQGYELRTSLDGLFTEHLTAASLAAARERFDERHAQIHGHAAKERPVEVVSYRLRVRVDVPKYQPRQEATPVARQPSDAAAKGMRKVHFGGKTAVDATLYERDRLGVGALVAGPAIVEQFDATTVIPAGWTGRVDGYRNLILERA